MLSERSSSAAAAGRGVFIVRNAQSGTAVIRAESGSDELLHELRRRGGEVDLAIAYRNIAAGVDLDALRALIADDAIDAVTFTSASTVDKFFARLTPGERSRVLQHATIASIGDATSAAIRRFGKEPDVVAKNATIQDLHDALVARS